MNILGFSLTQLKNAIENQIKSHKFIINFLLSISLLIFYLKVAMISV
jgi:hypothetical protein